MISVTLPIPPSVNHMYRRTKQGRAKTAKAKRFEQEVALIMRHYQPLTGDVELVVDVFRPSRRGDLDNYLKALQDALEGSAYHNDRQVKRIIATRYDDKDNPRCEIQIRSYNG